MDGVEPHRILVSRGSTNVTRAAGQCRVRQAARSGVEKTAAKRGRRTRSNSKPEQLTGPRARIRKVGQGGAMDTPVYVGIDVSKATLDVCISDGETWQTGNDDRSVERLCRQLVAVQPVLVVLEATGSYELRAAATFATAGLPVAVVNPRQVRSYARSVGQLAKTDRIDAYILTRFAEAVRPEARPLPDAETRELDAFVTRRRQLMAMVTAEQARLDTALAVTRKQITTHIAWLNRQIGRVNSDIDGTVRRSPLFRAKDELLQS